MLYLSNRMKWKNWNTVGHTSAIYRVKEMARCKALCYIIIEFCIPMQLGILIKMCFIKSDVQ